MKLTEIANSLQGVIVCGELHAGQEVISALASDLMSDVLTLHVESVLLMTGLCNIQTIRTCEMADISCIVFARGKKVTKEMLELAAENHMVLIETNFSLFKSSGILYEKGLAPIY